MTTLAADEVDALTFSFTGGGVSFPAAFPSGLASGTVSGIEVLDSRPAATGWTLTATFTPLVLEGSPTSTIPIAAIGSVGRILPSAGGDPVAGITVAEVLPSSAESLLPRLIATASAGTGGGGSAVELDVSIAVPAGQAAGRYLGTVTLDLVGN